MNMWKVEVSGTLVKVLNVVLKVEICAGAMDHVFFEGGGADVEGGGEYSL